jgi:hypothetical protein
VGWIGIPQFVVTGELDISSCVWNLADVDDEAFIHIELKGGTFRCNKMTVSPLTRSQLQFLSYNSNINVLVSCEQLKYEGVKSQGDNKHFTLNGGETSFTDSVCLINC